MHTFAPGYGLLPLTSYEPVRNDKHLRRMTPAQGQLTLDDLLATLPSARPATATTRSPGPDRRRIHQVLTALLEVHAGRRPAAQLSSWLTPALLHTLRTRARAGGPRYALRGVHFCLPSDTAMEVCGTAYTSARALAVTARFEHGVNGWRCTSFAVLEPR